MGLEQVESERGAIDLEEFREAAEEGKVPDQEAFTGIRPRGLDTDSDETSWGRESWRDARSQEAHEGVEPAAPRPRGRGKPKPERGCQTTKSGVIRRPGRVTVGERTWTPW